MREDERSKWQTTMRPDYVCELCDSREIARTHVLREMYFGTRELFDYIECAHCGSLQIAEVPDDLSRFYQKGYGPHASASVPRKVSAVRDWFRRERSQHLLHGRSLVGAVLSYAGHGDYFPYPWEWFCQAGVTPKSAILDVGCGNGDLLFALRECGFNRLVGIDLFRRGAERCDGVELIRGDIYDVAGPFDLVMSHHSMEHMTNLAGVLKRMQEIAVPRGSILIRLPVLGQSWLEYGENWVELDAPRHLVIPSVRGFRLLVERVGGLIIENVQFDGTSFELAGSELYAKDIPLCRSDLQGRTSIDLHFQRDELESFSQRIERMNAEGVAGRAAFHLRVSRANNSPEPVK